MSVILRVGAVKSVGGQEFLYGSGDEASSSYTDADVLDIPLPEHTYQRPLPPSSTQSLNSLSCFGLPYQDHNYGMPPPPSPPRPVSPRPPSPLQVNGIVEMEEEVKTTPLVSVAEEVVEDSITRCICGYLHDDGYMICCDKCSVWQHIDCMGVDRNNIPESYFCELCQPRTLDATKAKSLQKRKREELAARNVLSDSSATDTDPEEAANALASMGKKLPTTRKKGLKHKRSSKVKDKPPLKLKIGKPLKQKKIKNPGKKEKENIKATKSKKLFKQGQQKIKLGKVKNRPLLTTEQLNADPWNSNLSPWIDAYEHAIENQYSAAVKEFFCSSHMMDVSSVMSEHLLTQLTCVIVAEVKKNRKGLKATQEIPAGQVIIEYKGKVMLRHDYDKEYAFVNSFKKLQPFVLFYSKLDVDICVDARVYGNEARFIRRSCTPNSEVKHIFTQGKLFFVIVSQKDILAGSEITVSFDYNYQECSYCVECACVKNNCIVSRYWKKIKSAHNKSTAKDLSGKRRRQLSGSEVEKHSFYEASNSSTTQASPIQNVSSPIKTLPLKHPVPTSPTTKLSSPVKLSNVSTLLAASALLDEQPDLAKTLKLEVPDLLHQAPPPPAPPPQPHSKSATSSRRGSRVSEDAIKEEKVEVKILVPNKEKSLKVKETKTKDKDGKDHHYHHQELKKERRPSSRRQSQDEIEENLEVKNEVSNLSTIAGNESDDSNAGNECPRKKTREERKLDAIMKAFEKMEKREERRKEALARGETGTKKCHDLKPKKESESNIGNSNNSIHSRSTSQESSFEVEIKVENHVEDHADVKSPEPLIETKEDTPTNLNTNINVSSYFSCATSSAPTTETTKVIKDETSNKPARKPEKRKRRRSRVQSATAISDVASVSTEDGNSNSSFPPSLMSMPSTPVSAPANTSNPIMDTDGGIFKFIKTKKHLFEEWSNKQEDESTKHGQEMFVQCLPNPHVNTMDHLQRRNSSSSGCNSKSSECSAGSAKKRWLRQAMHEVPVPIAFHPSLSVNTDNGGTSPVHGGSSPNPGTGLGSPGSASPLDFVTPLKKRRLMRESLSVENNDGPLPFPSAGVLSENFSSNSIGFTTKTNGVKQIFPAHRHSVDDRLLHKGYSLHNGIREAGAQSDGKISTATNSRFSLTTQHTEQNDLDTRNRLLDQRTTESMPVSLREALPVSVPLPWVNGLSESAVTAPFTQQPSQFSLNFRGIYERMEVDSSEIINKEIVLKPIASSSRIDENGLHLLKSSYNTIEEVSRIDSSASTSAVVVVNSSTVYKSVNNLIDEGSEAGCVTAKTIMDEDSPATVRIDLNAHEMEPSSLTDGTRAVSLTDRYFGNSRQNMLSFSTCNECQVNSSEDVVDTLPLVTPDHNSDICDNVCTDSSSVQICGLRELDSQRTFNESLLKLEEIETVDSSQHVNRDQNHELPTVFEETDSLIVSRAVDVQPTASSTRRDVEYISSSGQATSHTEGSTTEHIIVCDSLEETEQHNVESGTVGHHCDSNNVQIDDERTEEDDASENEGMQTCDSMGINQASGHPFIRSTDETEEESGDTAVTESQSIDTHSFFSVSLDNNVDSTSSETNRSFHRSSFPNDNKETECGETMLTDNGCCDSNYERQPNDPSVLESLTAGDESLEGLGVSSSNGVDSQANNSSWDSYRRKDLQTEVYNDSAVSTENLECNSRISQSTPVVHNSSEVPAIQDQSDTSSETGLSSSFFARSGQVSATNCTVASSNPAPHSFTMSPPSSSLISSSPSSSMFSVECALSSTSPSTSSVQPATLTSSDVSSFSCSPPISSTGEATPSVKKKVSLLEYRKRLKEKPACCITETRTSETSTSSSSVIIHHKLSSTLSEFLSASPSASSSESPTKPIFQSSSHKQQFMPTLETLPLFKSDHNKDELKKKQKTEKPLSLTERLRLEFGLEDCGDDLNKKVKGLDVKRFKGRTYTSSPPPPPPPLHPSLLSTGIALPFYHLHNTHPAKRHSLLNGDESEVASSNDIVDDGAPPPPPPPTPSLNFTSATVGFNVTPLRGFHAQPAPLVNGGSGYNYQQQSNITSTSLTVQSSEISHGSRERETSFYAGQNGSSLTSILHSYPQQAPPSSTSHSNLQYPHTRTANLGSLSSVTASLLQSSTNHISFDFSQRQSQTVVSGNILPEDHPPPPPPPPRPHHRPSSAASTSHRQNHLQSSNGKSSKAASSSSSSTHYPDNRSRY